MPYNLLTCKGFVEEQGYIASGDCMPGRFLFVLFIFLVAIVQKWLLNDDGGFASMNFYIGLGFTLLPYLLLITLSGSIKWSGIAAIIGMAAWVGAFYLGFLGEGQ